MKIMTCSVCEEEFELLPGKPGRATVCPRCSEPNPEERVRQQAAADARHKSLTASVRSNARHREEERKHDIELDRLGFKKVPGKKFTAKGPK